MPTVQKQMLETDLDSEISYVQRKPVSEGLQNILQTYQDYLLWWRWKYDNIII